MAEVTKDGFVGKTQNEYFDEETALYLNIDPLWNLDPSTPDGLKLAADAERYSLLDEAARDAYNSKDPNKATGVELDMISAITGTFRALGTPSDVSLTLGGVNGTTVPAGSVAEDINGIEWETSASVDIAAGTAVVDATTVESGHVEAQIGSITKVKTVIAGWQTVTNIAIATPGTAPETDGQLRLRRAREVAGPGNNQVDNMLANILKVPDVRQAIVHENDTAITDVDGIPGHSLAILVDGGIDYDVALAIYLKKNPGVFLHPSGIPESIEVQSPDYPQQQKVIDFGRPDPVDVLVVVEITDDGTLPGTAEDEITEAIIAYASGAADTGIGFNTSGFDIGEDVAYSRMFTPVNQVIGGYGASYITTLTLDGLTTNTPIEFDALSRWVSGNITVTIT